MTLGEFGSTLNDELNRLANGGTYRDKVDMVDEALAAKQWANRENINPYSTDTVGILNEIAGLGLDKRNWLDFNGVCNYIAGTTGLPAAAALRQVYPTTDLLTGVASYYVDATAPTNWGSLGYVRLNGVIGNYLSVPDAAALDITGDIDIRVQAALDDWTPAALGYLIAKVQTGSTGISYGMYVNTNGTITFIWSSNGTTASTNTSSVAPTVSDGATLWIRATRVSSTGLTKFYTSTDGTNWTQLGTDVSGSSGSIFASTTSVTVGSRGDSGGPLAGNFYRAQVLDGIDGTTVLDVNIASNYTAASQSFFTATTGQTVTVNGVDTIANLGAAGSLLPTTLGSSTAADSNDPKFLDHTGTNYVYLPGVASNYLSLARATATDITGDLDLRVQLAFDDWTPSAVQYALGKTDSGTARAYILGINTDGTLRFGYSTDGSAVTVVSSTVATGISDGATKWIRATFDVNNGAGGNSVSFYLSDDGTTWTQLGTTVTNAGTVTMFNGNAPTLIGSLSGTTTMVAGKIFRAQILNGIDGTKVLDVDTSTLQTGADAYIVPTTYSGAAGAYFTGTGLSLNGVAGNYVSTPDASQLDITGDIDLRVQVALDDWTPATDQTLITKMATSIARSYDLRVLSTTPIGALNLLVSTDGTNQLSVSSTVATGIADGSTKWVRATRVAATGVVQFFTSDDGTAWTQLGADVSTTAGNIFSSTSALEVGSRFLGTSLPARGTFYRAQVLSGIDGFPVFDATFVGVPANSLRMIESSTYKAVVTLNTTRYCTINRSTSGRKTVAVTQPTWLFGTDDYMEVNNRYMASGTYLYLPGVSTNYASVPDSAALDITGDIDVRVKVAMDDWTPSSAQYLIAKLQTQRSYGLQLNTDGRLVFVRSTDGSATTSVFSGVTAVPFTDGATGWVRVTFDVDNGAGSNETKFFTSTDGTTWTQLGTTQTNAGTTATFNSNAPLEIGSGFAGVSGPSRGKFFRAQVLNGIGGTVAFDANFEGSITSLNQASFTESSTNAATVTINRSGSAYRSAGITTAGYLYPGATNTFAASAIGHFELSATDSLTAIAVARQWNTPTSFGRYFSKNIPGNSVFWAFMSNGTTANTWWAINSGSGEPLGQGTGNNTSIPYTIGGLSVLGFRLDRTAADIRSIVNSTISSGISTSSVGAISSPSSFRIGNSAGTNYQDTEIVAVAVFRQALTAAQIRQISNYFANREVYL